MVVVVVLVVLVVVAVVMNSLAVPLNAEQTVGGIAKLTRKDESQMTLRGGKGK